MPNASRQTASERFGFEGIDVRLENFEGGYTVCFESHAADADLARETIPVVMDNLQARSRDGTAALS